MEEIKTTLKWYEQMGVDEIILDESAMLNKSLKKSAKRAKIFDSNDLSASARMIAEQCNSLEDLREALENFEGLSIKKTATNLVFADGNQNAQIMAIGEAPGANEDEEGIPFCGASGKLLDQILRSIDLDRSTNLYITNSVFWRPPANRKPTPEENAVCLPFVEKHIAILKPKLILLVGATAAATLLESSETISRLRSKFYQYKNRYLEQAIPAAVLFHPSYLLRQPQQKKTVWFDLLKIKKEFLQK